MGRKSDHDLEPSTARIERDLLQAVAATHGHFVYESGHHGDLWLDLDRLLVDARRVREWAAELARRAAHSRPEVVCGPLTGGAFVAQAVAAELGAAFVFAERHAAASGPVRYRIPDSLREPLRGRRLLLVDDAVNAGSALLGTLADARACGAQLAGFASLLALGDAAAEIASREGAPFFTLALLKRNLWPPAGCPLCASGTPFGPAAVSTPHGTAPRSLDEPQRKS
jgi:orotate phosphoribosyltransferase